MVIDIIGFLAAFRSTVSLIPQIIKTFRTKSAEDVSFFMLVNFLMTSLLWLLYGLMIGAVAGLGGECDHAPFFNRYACSKSPV